MGSAARISNYAAVGVAQLISMYAKLRGNIVALLPVVLGITPNTGPTVGGTLVRITGYNFESVSSVTIGGIACTGLIVGGGIITCYSPAGSVGAAKDVVVTGPAGPTTLAGAFTYTIAAVVTGISPSSGALAGGTSVSITVSNSLGCTGASVGGVPLTGFAISDGTHVTGTTGAHAAGATDVIVTNAAGPSLPLVGAYTYSAGGAAVVSAVAPNVGDIAGGGNFVTITVNNSAGCTGATLGGVAMTSFSVVDGSHVKGIPGAHAQGVVDAVVTNGSGPSTGGTGLFEYWTPKQITGAIFYDAELGVTQAAGAVSQWNDQGGGGINATQSVGANKPAWTASVFGSFHSLRFTQATPSFLTLSAAQLVASTGKITWRAGIKSTNATATAAGAPGVNPANTIFGTATGGGACNGGFGGGGTAGRPDNVAYDGAIWQEATGGATVVNDGNPHIVGGNVDGTGKTNQCVRDGANVGGAVTLGAGGFVTSGWDSIGTGFSNLDGFGGDLGWLLYTPNAVSGTDDTKMTTWSRQRWGTP